MREPGIISFPAHGDQEEGYLYVMEGNRIPFQIRRVVFARDTPEGVVRGRHAHYQTEMILIAMTGRIEVRTITKEGALQHFVLADPHHGLYLPVLCWHEMTYSRDAVQLMLTNTEYDEADYIRDWEIFREVQAKYARR